MKKLSVFALVAALAGSACGGGTFGPVTEIDQTKTLFITLDLPSGQPRVPTLISTLHAATQVTRLEADQTLIRFSKNLSTLLTTKTSV